MKETWYFVNSGYGTPAFNMALDETLLKWHSEGKIPPVLRFYGWAPAGLSVGYFQKVNGKIDLEGLKRHGVELVRRLTGGQAVLHDEELTYSVIVSEQHEAMPKLVKEAYLVISKGLLEGFKELGLQADFAIPEGKLTKSGSAVCFEEPSWYELMVEGKKAAGSAQTRQKGVILQHGSIPINMDETKLFDLFVYPNDRVKERAKKSFANKAVAVNEVADIQINFEEACHAFKKGFARGLDVELKSFEPTSELLEETYAILEEKYSKEEWNYKR